uniref:Uncharacterized protein n=1 Tax=Anguilla anguilla TaxID=7936 RepID=A0A0E9SQB8_ANGAN
MILLCLKIFSTHNLPPRWTNFNLGPFPPEFLEGYSL